MQLSLAIADPTEPARILPQDGRAKFTINWLSPKTGRLNRQWIFDADELETVLPMFGGQPNIYMSQAFFDRPMRRSSYVQYATHAYADLDIYNLPGLSGLSRDGLVRRIRAYCRDEGIPLPSAILSSGRGVYLKWYFRSPVGRAWVGKLVALNRALVRRLAQFGADPQATDATRILRLTGSLHTGAGRKVDLIWQEKIDGDVLTYNPDELARAVVPGASDEPSIITVAQRERARGTHPRFTTEGWYWAIVEDVQLLARLRYPGGIVRQGMRDLFGHVIAVALSRIYPADLLMPEIIAQCRMILPIGYAQRDVLAQSKSLLNLAKRALSYAYSKGRLIELLRITPAEDRLMSALISDGEKVRRHTEHKAAARRATGMMLRADYEAPAAGMRPIIDMRRRQGATWDAISAELGISARHARRLHTT